MRESFCFNQSHELSFLHPPSPSFTYTHPFPSPIDDLTMWCDAMWFCADPELTLLNADDERDDI